MREIEEAARRLAPANECRLVIHILAAAGVPVEAYGEGGLNPAIGRLDVLVRWFRVRNDEVNGT